MKYTRGILFEMFRNQSVTGVMPTAGPLSREGVIPTKQQTLILKSVTGCFTYSFLCPDKTGMKC